VDYSWESLVMTQLMRDLWTGDATEREVNRQLTIWNNSIDPVLTELTHLDRTWSGC